MVLLQIKATPEEFKIAAEHFSGYIKVVVDLEREILVAGGDKHSDEEKMLLEDGSAQKNLWGGGLDLKTKEIDYNSMINLRPSQDNPSRDILSTEIRTKFDEIVKKILL